MAATKESANPKGVCEKFFDVISTAPGYRSIRRISHHPQDPASHAAPTPPPSNINANRTQITHNTPVKPEKPVTPKVSRPIDLTPTPGKKVAEVVPPKAVPLFPKAPAQKEKPVAAAAKAGREIDIFPTPGSDPSDGKPKSRMNAGTAVKAVVQHGKEVAGKVHLPKGSQEREKVEPAEVEDGKKSRLTNINEKASDYIARAKYKIRTTTTMFGGGSDGNQNPGGHGRTA